MKTLNLFITLLFINLCMQAQYSKGTQLLAGSFGFQNSQNKMVDISMNQQSQNYHSYQLRLFARYGYFLTDHWLIGAYGNYSYATDRGVSNMTRAGSNSSYYSSSNTSGIYTLGIYSRYYQTLSKRFSWFAQLSAGAGKGESNSKTYNDNSVSITENKSNSKSFYGNIDFAPGVLYFLNSKIAVEASYGNLGYSYYKSRNFVSGAQTYENKNSSFNSNFFLSFSNILFGINYYFGGSKKANIVEAKKE